MRDGLFICSNGPVYAIVGDARNPHLQELIREVKGSRRAPDQPVGWTVPFDHPAAVGIFDTSQIKNGDLRRLIDAGQNELTERIGAVAFLRGPADMKVKAERGIPDCIVPPDTRTVQIYSPAGNRSASAVIEAIIVRGGEPVMTSANVSGYPEITTEQGILEFQSRSGLSLLQMTLIDEDPDRLHVMSSYPVLELHSDGFVPVRTGCLGLDVIERLLKGYPIGAYDPGTLPEPSNPDSVLAMKDMPEAANAYGAELRQHVLRVMGLEGPVRAVLRHATD